MSDLEALLAILVALYASECVVWLRRDAACVRRTFGKTHRFIAGNLLSGGDSGGVLLLNPLPPFGAVYRAQPMPLSIAPEGVLVFIASSFVPGPRTAQSGRWLAFADAKPFHAEEARVFVGNEPLVTVSSAKLARHVATWLETLRRMPLAARAAAIEAEIERSFDDAPLRAGVDDLARASRGLTALATVQFVLLFFVLPGSLALNVLETTWPILVLGVPSCSAATVTRVWRIRRKLAPAERAERWKAAVFLAISPLATLRARDTLTIDLAATHHPLALARALCSPAEFQRVAAGCLRDAHAPYGSEQPELSVAAERAERFWRERQIRALERCVESVRDALAPPSKLASDCVAYCARCEHQFTRVDSACSDCGDRPLTPFEPARATVS